jgi:hypothetical protein
MSGQLNFGSTRKAIGQLTQLAARRHDGAVQLIEAYIANNDVGLFITAWIKIRSIYITIPRRLYSDCCKLIDLLDKYPFF